MSLLEVTKKEERVISFEPKKKIYVGESAFTPIEIKENENIKVDDFGHISFYPTYIGHAEHENGFDLVIMIDNPLKDKNKSRKLIARVRLGDSDIMEMADFVTAIREQHGTIINRGE